MCRDGEEVAERRREQRSELLFGEEFEEGRFEVVYAILQGGQEPHCVVGESGMVDERIGGCRDGRRDGSRGTRCASIQPRPARSVAPAVPSRHTSHALGCKRWSFTLTFVTTTLGKMTASIWHANHERCRELASPDIFNFVISV